MSLTPPPSEHDERLERVLADYLHAVEAGKAPERVELLKEYPDLAADLDSFFRNRDAMERIAGPIKAQLPEAETIDADDDTAGGTTVRYIGDYELLEEIARGGMGVVYKARQVSLDRLVALKMILAGQFAREADVKRFRLEAEAAAQLDHPNIVPIYEVGTHDGHHYYAMQYVDGPSLARLPDRATWSNHAIAELLRTCALAVQYAHERGVVHRDLKPGNILIASVVRGPWSVVKDKEAGGSLSLAMDQGPRTTDFLPKITDFGLAKRVGQGGSLTVSGTPMGTPGYMAPEQASGTRDVGPAADVYALGATLYDLLTGRPPFQAATPWDTVLQVIGEEPAPPSQLQPKVPRDLETICLKCLDKRPDRRYPSAQALAEDLQRFLDYEPIQGRAASRARRLGAWVRKRPWAVVGFAMLSVLAVALIAQALYLESRRERLDNLYRDAQIARLSLAQQAAPAAAHALRPAAERALERLRQAAALRPEGRLYEEALEVLRVEHRGGRRIYPLADGRVALPRAWVKPDTEFPRPFALSQDGTILLLPDQIYHLDTGTAKRGAVLPIGQQPRGSAFSADGRRVARMAANGQLQVRTVDTDERVGAVSAPYPGVFALSPDGTTLAWSGGFSGVTNGGVQLRQVASGELLHMLPPTGPVAIIRIAYTPDGKYIIGQAGYSQGDAVYNSFGRAGPDGTLTPEFAEHSDRLHIWDAADGTLLAWLPGRMFADGFGPDGELVVARAVHVWGDGEPEVALDLWRPADLIAAIENERLTGWVHFASAAPGSGIPAWVGHLTFVPLFVAIGWMLATVTRAQQKRITIAWAHGGIGLAVALIGVGTAGFVLCVAELSGAWGTLLRQDHLVRNGPGLMCGLYGLLYLVLAFPVGRLAIQCYSHAAYGEAVAFFERLQAVPEEERRRDEERAQRMAGPLRRWLLAFFVGMPIILMAVSYLDGSVFWRIFSLLPVSWESLRSLWIWFLMSTMLLLPSFVVLLLLQCILALAELRWGPAKEPWFTPWPGTLQTRAQRAMYRFVSSFPLSRGATVVFWLIVLLAALALASFEISTRLAAGNWPRRLGPLDADGIDGDSSALLALAVFYTLASLVRLVQIATTRDREALFNSDA